MGLRKCFRAIDKEAISSVLCISGESAQKRWHLDWVWKDGLKLVTGLLDHQRPKLLCLSGEKRWYHEKNSGVGSNPSSALKTAMYFQPFNIHGN